MNQIWHSCAAVLDPGSIRYEDLGGVPHLVAPITPLVEGVLTAANIGEPELALASEFGRNVQQWNGRPITLGHPQARGESVSAGDAVVHDTQVIGMFLNAHLDGDRIRGEAWINLDLVAHIGERAQIQVDRIVEGEEEIEVSSGFFSQLDTVAGEYSGEEYVGIQRNHMPDHIALLDPGETGACSFEDGCGIRANESGDDMKVLRQAREPRFSGVSGDKSADHSFSAYAKAWASYSGLDAPENFEATENPFRIFAANHSLLGRPQGTTWEEVVCLPVVDPKTCRLNSNLLYELVLDQCQCDHLDEIASGSLKSARGQATALLQNAKHDDDEDEEHPRDNTHAGSDADLRDAIKAALNSEGRYFQSVPHVYADAGNFIVTRPNSETFETEFFQRDFTMDADSRVVLGEEEVRVRQLTSFILASAGREGTTVQTNQERASALITNGTWNEDDRELLEGMTDAQLSRLETNSAPVHDADADECACADCVTLRTNASADPGPITEAQLPADVQRFVARGRQAEQQERTSLVTAIRGVNEAAFTEAELKDKSIEELRQLGVFAKVPDFSVQSTGTEIHANEAIPPTEALFSATA